MLKTTLSFTTAALLAAVPMFAAADGVAASLSASFGNGPGGTVGVNVGNLSGNIQAPTSVSVAGAAGDFAVASSVATAQSSGAAAGATDSTDYLPVAEVTYRGGPNAYETTVSFGPTPDTVALIAQAVCAQISAVAADPSISQTPFVAALNNSATNTPVGPFQIGPFGVLAANVPGSVVDTEVTVTGGVVTATAGAIQVVCTP